MAFNKKEEFSTKEQSLAAFAKAISHPARIAILNVLAKKQRVYMRTDSGAFALGTKYSKPTPERT